ncbi:MAG: MFS transporter [Chloroflexota bacterium]
MEERQSFTRLPQTWVIYIAIAAFSYLINSLSGLLPRLGTELNLSYVQTSLHSSAFGFGLLIVGLVGGLLKHFGNRQLFSVSILGMAIGCALISISTHPTNSLFALLMMSVCGALLPLLVPVALRSLHPRHDLTAITEANTLASAMAVIAPLSFAIGLDWRTVYVLVAGIMVLILWPVRQIHATSFSEQPIATTSPRTNTRFWQYWIMLFLAISLEFSTLYWGVAYLSQVHTLTTATATQWIALVLVGMFIGRFLGSRLSMRLSAESLILLSICVLAIGLYGLLQTSWTQMALLIIGLGIANLYPSVITLAMANHQSAAQAGVRAVLALGCAIVLLPLSLGWLADIVGLRYAFNTTLTLLLTTFSLVFLFIQWRRSAATE